MILLVEFGSKEYLRTLFLRNDMVECSRGKNIFTEDLSSEESGYTVAYYFGNELVGSCLLMPLNYDIVRLVYLCVRYDYKDKGIEKEIFDFCMELLRDKNFKKIISSVEESHIELYKNYNFKEVSKKYLDKYKDICVDMECVIE